jgi:hypothetical protein
VAPTVISAAKVYLPLRERKLCQVQSKEQNRAESGRLEPRIMGTNWHYKGADLAKSILRMEGQNAAPHHLSLKGTHSGPSLCNQTLRLIFGGSRVQMRLPITLV